jgi:plasmid stabilization system protein ParE
MIPCRPEPEASAELEDAALWYESQRPGLGQEFLQAVDAALELIGRWPQIGRRVASLPDDVAARRAPVNRFPYHEVYLEWQSVIRILAFAHDHREPGYWSSRIRK